jgi:hypothetical protein
MTILAKAALVSTISDVGTDQLTYTLAFGYLLQDFPRAICILILHGVLNIIQLIEKYIVLFFRFQIEGQLSQSSRTDTPKYAEG